MVKAYILNGLGIGCHEECAHAYQKAGADAEIIHIRELLTGAKKLSDCQILNMTGGFLHGDNLGAGMCAANELEHSIVEDKKLKDMLIAFADKGNVIYGQCNGFQLLVKTGLLPGIDNDYSKQTVTLTHNDCGSYRVAPVMHGIAQKHFAFEGVEHYLTLWCRHGEGKLMFHAPGGLVTESEGNATRAWVNANHTLLRYVNPKTKEWTDKFPHSPNGSVDGIAGLVNLNGNIFGHMAHTEISIYKSRGPEWFAWKEQMRRQGVKANELDEKMLEGECLKVFKNIVNYVK